MTLEAWNYSISVVIYTFMFLTFFGSIALYTVYKLRERARKRVRPQAGHGVTQMTVVPLRPRPSASKPRLRFGA